MSTETPVTSKDLLPRVDAAWTTFRLAIAAIGADALARTTPSGWTYQSLVAHVAAWHRNAAGRLGAFRSSGTPARGPDESDDEFNARAAAAAAGKAPNEILSELDASWRAIRQEIAALADETLAAHDGWAAEVVRINTDDHYEAHRAELFAAVPSTPRALRATIEPAWARFRALASAADVDRDLGADWTVKGMLAHVAYWLEVLPQELPIRLEGRRSPPGDFDQQNLRIAADAARLDRDGVLARLDAGYATTMRAIAALPQDREIDFMAIRLIAGETYEHFREHRSDLEGAR